MFVPSMQPIEQTLEVRCGVFIAHTLSAMFLSGCPSIYYKRLLDIHMLTPQAHTKTKPIYEGMES